MPPSLLLVCVPIHPTSATSISKLCYLSLLTSHPIKSNCKPSAVSLPAAAKSCQKKFTSVRTPARLHKIPAEGRGFILPPLLESRLSDPKGMSHRREIGFFSCLILTFIPLVSGCGICNGLLSICFLCWRTAEKRSRNQQTKS